MSDFLQSHGLEPTRLLFHGILQAKILEWVAIPFSRGSYRPRDRTEVTCVHCRKIVYCLSFKLDLDIQGWNYEEKF